MQANLPKAFVRHFDGPDGPYAVAFDPEKDSFRLWVTSGGQSNFWMIDFCKPISTGWELGGLTGPAWAQWDGVYWAGLFIGGEDERVEFSGKQGLARTDRPLVPRGQNESIQATET